MRFLRLYSGFFMVAVAIGAFNHKVIRALDLLRVANDRAFFAADIAGKNEFGCFSVFFHPNFDGRRPQQMSDVIETCRYT